MNRNNQDTITIWAPVKSNGEPCWCAKNHSQANGSISTASYDNLFSGVFKKVAADTIERLHKVIAVLASNPNLVVVNAIPLVDSKDSQRRIVRGDDPSMAGYAHRWVCLDYDADECPPDLSAHDAVEWIVAHHTPPEFRGVSYVRQFSSSAKIKGNGWGKVHLWYLLDTPLDHQQLKDYINPISYGLDPATLRRAQVLYTANPSFEGMSDPLEEAGVNRVELIRKQSDVVVVDPVRLQVIEEQREAATHIQPRSATVGNEGRLRAQAMELCNHLPVGSMHHPELLKLASALRRCCFEEGEIHHVLSAVKNRSSGSDINKIIADTRQNDGMRAGIPTLEALAGMKLQDAQRIIDTRRQARSGGSSLSRSIGEV
ncbi:hypothetical protein OKS80_00800 [Aeromonas veronii]|uniref:hypothetical protein n=1 Tax=Aeromonas veronii TaxID=654 RepID=UPI00226CF5D1|nr:hypothetical protein [Aeromonas veronii]MCX9111434.1 hypothetical protein [Aeromonas veronii]